jgi:hypothetical protein
MGSTQRLASISFPGLTFLISCFSIFLIAAASSGCALFFQC